jgi:hypothetical protein
VPGERILRNTGGNTARPAPQVAAGPEPDAALATTLAVSNSQQEARAPHYDRSRSEPAGQEGEDKAGWLRMLQVYTKSPNQADKSRTEWWLVLVRVGRMKLSGTTATARRHVRASPHDHAASMKGSTPRCLGRRRPPPPW